MDPGSGIHAGQLSEENMSYAMPDSDAVVNAGQKRSASSALEGESPNKKSKNDDDDSIHEGNGYSQQHYEDNSLIQDQNVARGYGMQKGDGGYGGGEGGEYGVSPGRKTGRMAGAKGYSLQEIQALFSFIRQKPPVDNSDWVSLAMRYNRWAKENKKSPRTGRGLKDKLRKVAMVSKEDKLKHVASLTPIQQDARDCIKCINIETSRLVDANEKEEQRPHVDMGGLGDGVLRDRTNEMFATFQPSQLSELADLLRTVLHDARQTSQRLTNIEQMMETLKGAGDCGIDNLSEQDGKIIE
uniref:Uncharacterized protein n=1 Tax=Paramoeba aestuarina TaxID=180227 RepID=A0A7S4NSS9_9EUKA|mmetsp:Transcript_26612/g.41457  ORF Transcript_26612/g.41457 Transcript_26612/m.41457 type:complete len:298 (+) Transcript_26612:164-1057(+)|eukprot:CAMPEP_0201515960 /NCGR_PEP_ID=MMETSP0161_2-20130828/7397_1 /ASSEMBLY_ACC=CAM_ASM_000251 /TAXON_ID=180227 /ORGANISM="Neoparamoeba aestuarina, Strain SoJaBio B1-5/56/2" /LENGTH=297 /DNA_ID=CAMNT_0047912925 /DNA_START=150 /DNA_END=1043 /DNA_ORIENTATION=-